MVDRRHLIIGVVVGLVMLAGCTGGGGGGSGEAQTQGGGGSGEVATSNELISIGSNPVSVGAGRSTSVEVSANEDAPGDVTIETANVPSGMTASLGSNTVSPGSSTQLEINEESGQGMQQYKMDLEASSGDTSSTLDVTVETAPPTC